jgi:hypothetical protein
LKQDSRYLSLKEIEKRKELEKEILERNPEESQGEPR